VLLLVTTPDTDRDPSDSVLDEDDRRTIAALLDGDEQAFEALIRRYHGSLLRLAMTYVRPRSAAEEVVQDTWLGVLRGLPTFEGRSSLRTWIYRILVNQARTRGVRESRSVPFSALGGEGEPAVDPDRFLPAHHPAYAGHWASAPRRWDELPDALLLASETREQVLQAIDELPPQQREVITLRDVEGWSSAEVREALDLSEGNQRVLLHRARARVRERLERYLDEAAA
jgi:RNA polymerase sigma-70 factor (ECF subfamily)